MAPGSGFTEIAFIAKQPVDSVYVIVAEPAARPETTPVELTVATAPLLVVHVPPEIVFVKGVAEPSQTVVLPDMADGVMLTVIVTNL